MTEAEGQMQMCLPASCQRRAQPVKEAGNEEERRLFPRLLPCMLPFPITGIRSITSCDGAGGGFSQCPEAAPLSAHKHLWEWLNRRVWKWTRPVITASGFNCQSLTTSHMQRKAAVKFIIAIGYLKKNQFISMPGGLMDF